MALLIDTYFGQRTKVGHVFCVAKPCRPTFLQRLKDVVGVVTGRYDAVKFVVVELQKDKKFREEFATIPPEEVERIKGEAMDLILKKHGRMNKFNDLKIGRNAFCPCGSGKKYKLCCGK